VKIVLKLKFISEIFFENLSILKVSLDFLKLSLDFLKLSLDFLSYRFLLFEILNRVVRFQNNLFSKTKDRFKKKNETKNYRFSIVFKNY